uniref:DDB1-and CUL4-associated factor 8 isoform X1 n=1 Tax=Rhizophora mucronata TaxID=61149 RepID=A0A2P2JMI0_RHIMU
MGFIFIYIFQLQFIDFVLAHRSMVVVVLFSLLLLFSFSSKSKPEGAAALLGCFIRFAYLVLFVDR